MRIHRERALGDWNTYAIVAIIELERGQRGNPDVPEWLASGYRVALVELAELGVQELRSAADEETSRSILAVLALWRGLRTHARLLLDFSESEVEEITSRSWTDAR